MGQIIPDFFQIHALCKSEPLNKNIPSDVRLIFLARRSSLLSVLFTYPAFSKKSVMRVILVLVNWSFWLISEGDRQWFSAANNVVRTIYAEWFIPYTPRNSDILSCILLFVRIQSCINKCSRKGYAGSLFFGVWLFFLMCLCYSFHYSPYYWNTLSVYKRASVIR